jgi:hypothetical protein
MSGASSGGGAAAGLLQCSQRGPWACDVTSEYSRGTPSYAVQCAGTVGAHGCCWCGVVPPERPSPLRVRSYLSNNKLTGSVPSSLSTLTNLVQLCVAPSCQRRFHVRPRRVGSVGSAPSSAACRGVHVWGIERARCGSRACCGTLRRDLGAHDVTTEYSRGTPPMGTVRGYRTGTSLLWVRRSTAERPSPLRVCSDLHQNALTGSVPSSLSALINLERLCVPPSCQRRLRVRPRRVGIGRLCSERAACRGMHVWGIERGRCGSRAVAVLSEGTPGTRCD